MANVLQLERALRQQQWHLNGDAVVAVVQDGRLFGCAQGIVHVVAGGLALVRLVPAQAVVIYDGYACDSEEGANGERLRPEWNLAQQG